MPPSPVEEESTVADASQTSNGIGQLTVDMSCVATMTDDEDDEGEAVCPLRRAPLRRTVAVDDSIVENTPPKTYVPTAHSMDVPRAPLGGRANVETKTTECQTSPQLWNKRRTWTNMFFKK